jgi:hypothetical protein
VDRRALVWQTRAHARRTTITILDHEFSFTGTANCLRFRCSTGKPGKNRLRDNNYYTYCPEKGLVNLTEN